MSASAAEVGRQEPREQSAARTESWLSWAGAISLLVLVVWIVPIKTYRLPVNLPFSLEIYRLVLIVLLGAWLLGIVTGTLGISAGGLARPLLLLAAAGTLSIIANTSALSKSSLESQAIKSLSYFLSFLLAYVLVCSTINSVRGVELVVRALVLGAAVIAVFAVYEARTGYDVFQHLHKWFSFMQPTRDLGQAHRRGTRLRVRASAQHPIALGAALTMAMPLAVYLASRARDQAGRIFWGACAVLVLVGALTTVSRTIVLMALAMAVVALVLRRQLVTRYWPVLLVLVAVVHVAAPHTLGSLYNSFLPQGGLVQSQNARFGEIGSGRLADVAPGLRSWKQTPLFGHGLGTGKTSGTNEPGAITDPKTGAPIIFDDQYLNSLVSIGLLGLLGVLWFVWGAVVAMVRGTRRLTGATSDLVAACAAACAGFGAGMLTFDAFSFVQCTLIFFVIAALGLRTRQLAG